MPEFVFNPDLKDSGRPTPLSWRFGEYRRWHPTHDFLYEIREHGTLAWAACLRFKDDETVVVHPHHQNPENPQNRIAECNCTSDKLQEPAEQNKC